MDNIGSNQTLKKLSAIFNMSLENWLEVDFSRWGNKGEDNEKFVLPFIKDTKDNSSGILDMCIEAKVYGVICFGMGLTLREGN